MTIVKLRSEWTHDEIVRVARLACRDHGLDWNSTLEWQSRDELSRMLLSPTGRYGGFGQGHELVYVSRQPEYEFSVTKLKIALGVSDTVPQDSDKIKSRGHVWISKRNRKTNRKDLAKDDPGYEMLMGTGHASFGLTRQNDLREPAHKQTQKAFDPDEAAAILSKKFRVSRHS